jgi:hypothetical protein
MMTLTTGTIVMARLISKTGELLSVHTFLDSASKLSFIIKRIV